LKSKMTNLLLCSLVAMSILTHTKASADEHVEKQKVSNIPMLLTLNQTSSNQLQVTYDQPVDNSKGINPMNYWIQSTQEKTPTGIATLGMNDKVNSGNLLTAEKVTIQPLDSSGKSFLLTFKQNINKGIVYKMIICYVTKPGEPPFNGDNGSASFVGL
jgi:hypothetical protein